MSHHENRRHRLDRLRLPDVVSREVHRALPAGAHGSRQPQLPRRHDGQAARRLRAEHRLHAGAARRAAAADGDGGRGLRRVPRTGSRRPASTRRHVKQIAGKFTASFFCSTDQDNNQIASFYTGAMADAGAAVVPRRAATAGWRSSRRTIRARWCSTPTSAGRSASATSSIPGQQCARMSGDELTRGRRRRDDRHLQRLRVRAAAAEDRARRGRRSSQHSEALIVTRGEHGSSVLTASGRTDVAAVTPRRIVDPTGVGDAFRGGLMKGLALGLSPRDRRAARQRRRDLRARASRRPEPRVHVGRVQDALRGALPSAETTSGTILNYAASGPWTLAELRAYRSTSSIRC